MGRVLKTDGEITGGSRNKKLPVTGVGDNAVYGDAIKYRFKKPSEDPSRCPYAISASQGVLDLVKDHPNWCKNGRNKLGYDDLIWADIKFYQPRLSSIVTNLFSNISGALNVLEAVNEKETEVGIGGLSASNPYEDTVLAHDTMWSLRIPLLQKLPEVRSSQFGDGEDGKLGGGFGNVLSDLKGVLTNNPAAKGMFGKNPLKTLGIGSVLGNASGLLSDIGKIFFPSINSRGSENYFRSQNLNNFELSFELLNSISPEETKWNHSLITLLTLLCSSNDRNKFISDSPTIVSIDLGTRFVPLASINFSYESSGNYLLVDGIPTPEVFQCKLEINEKIPSTRGLELAYMKDGTKLEAIQTNPEAFCDLYKKAKANFEGVGSRSSSGAGRSSW